MKWIIYIILIGSFCLIIYGLIVGLLKAIIGIKTEDPYKDRKKEVANMFIERLQVRKKKGN